MSASSRRCRACGAVNRPGAMSCYSCGRHFVASNQRQQVLRQQQKNKLHNRRMRLLKLTKINIGIAFILLLLLFILMFITNPGLTPGGAVAFLVFFPLLLPGHISDALQGDFSFQTNFTTFFFLLLLSYALLIYIILAVLYFIIKKLRVNARV